jgi:hypothetical protein
VQKQMAQRSFPLLHTLDNLAKVIYWQDSILGKVFSFHLLSFQEYKFFLILKFHQAKCLLQTLQLNYLKASGFAVLMPLDFLV